MSIISILADVHIADSPEQSMGIDTQSNFARAVTHLRSLRPEQLVLLGDFSLRQPERAQVDWVASRAKMVGAPVLAIAGNHDAGVDVARAFNLPLPPNSVKLYYRRDIGAQRALFLDTSAGYIDADQLDWLHMEIRGSRGSTLVFMHHPPTEMGVPFMDARHAFRDGQGEVFQLLFGGTQPVHVFCGHYHTARSVHIGIHSIHLCPSTYFQLDPSKREFAVSHAMPGIRHVHLLDGQFRTWIEFLPLGDMLGN